MADPLTRLLPHGRDLLARVDHILATHGVPAGHCVLPLIANLGVLPGDALEFVASLRPEALHKAAACLPTAADFPLPPASWTGPAADAFRQRWKALDRRQSALVEHIGETAEYATAVANWMVESRNDMAVVLAAILGSAEAVMVRTEESPLDTVAAAAAIGHRVLAAVTLCDVAAWSKRLVGARLSAAVDTSRVEPSGRTAGFTL